MAKVKKTEEKSKPTFFDLSEGFVREYAKEQSSLKEARDNGDSRRTSWHYFKKPGQHKVRIGPPWKDPTEQTNDWLKWTKGGLCIIQFTHSNLPGHTFKESPIAIANSYPHLGKSDPILELKREAEMRGIQFGQSEGINKYRISRKAFMNVIVRDPDPDGVNDPDHWQIGCFPISVFDWLVETLDDMRKDGAPQIVNPFEGFDIYVRKSGGGVDTKYAPSFPHTGSCKLHNDPDILENLLKTQKDDRENGMPPLDEILGFTDKKAREIAESCDKIRATLGLAKGNIVAVTSNVNASGNIVAVTSNVNASGNFDPKTWADKLASDDLVEFQGNNVPKCYSEIPGNMYLSSPSISQVRQENSDKYSDPTKYVDVPGDGKILAACMICNVQAECQAGTQDVGQLPTPN